MQTYYAYINKETKEEYTLPQLQNKYNLGFADTKLWKIIEMNYTTVTRTVGGESADIIFEDDIVEEINSTNNTNNLLVYVITETITDQSEYTHPVDSIYKIIRPTEDEKLEDCEKRVKQMCKSLTKIGKWRREEYSYEEYEVE